MSTIAPSLATWRLAAQSLGAPSVLQDSNLGKNQYRRQAGAGVACLPVCRGQRCSATATAVVCGLFVAATAGCKPRQGSSGTRSLRFESSLARSRCRRRRKGNRGGSMSGEGGDWGREVWDESFWAGGGGDGGSGSNGGGGSGWGSDGCGDHSFHRVLFECMWLWQLICGMSMLQSCYFMMFRQQDITQFGPHAGPANIMPARVAVTC